MSLNCYSTHLFTEIQQLETDPINYKLKCCYYHKNVLWFRLFWPKGTNGVLTEFTGLDSVPWCGRGRPWRRWCAGRSVFSSPAAQAESCSTEENKDVTLKYLTSSSDGKDNWKVVTLNNPPTGSILDSDLVCCGLWHSFMVHDQKSNQMFPGSTVLWSSWRFFL